MIQALDIMGKEGAAERIKLTAKAISLKENWSWPLKVYSKSHKQPKP
jgi:hypothetical protein